MGCRKSPVGRKSATVNVFPESPTQLEVVQLVVTASQDESWRGTNVKAVLTCPGLRRDITTSIPNGTPTSIFNGAGVVLGKYKGTASFSWPNGQKLVVNFFYEVIT